MWWSRAGRALLSGGLLLVLPAACGFQARTAMMLPENVNTVYIAAEDRYSSFYQALDHRLRQAGLALARNSSDADAVIQVEKDETGQALISVSAQNKPREYDVFYNVRYSVSRNGRTVLQTQSLTARRTYNYDETEVLGKALEERSLRDALAQDLVSRLMRRLSTLN